MQDFATSIDHKKKPFLASICLVNLASAFHHYCIEPHAQTLYSAGEFYGSSGCDITYAKEKLVPYITNAIYVSPLIYTECHSKYIK